MIKSILIDDEKNAIKFIESIIAENLPDVKVVGTGSSALEGIKTINKTKPDIVFLDIEMPDGSGFDILEAIGKRRTSINSRNNSSAPAKPLNISFRCWGGTSFSSFKTKFTLSSNVLRVGLILT